MPQRPNPSFLALMPRLTVRTELLDELDAHDCYIQELRLQRQLSAALSDLSSSSSSSSSPPSRLSPSSPFSFGSPISIDTPDVQIPSDNSLHSRSPNMSTSSRASSSDSGLSSPSFSDLEEDAYLDWRRRYTELVHHVLTSRVLFEAPPVVKSPQLHLLEEWRTSSPDRFRRKLRVDPDTFDGLVALIEAHEIFSNNSNCPQLPVPLQLSVFLFRAGHYGNAASPEDVAQWAGISVGGVEKCTDRVIISLLSLHDEAIHFPGADDKERAKAFVEANSCPEWRGGFLVVDGTKIPLFQRPGLHGDTWFDKDGGYSVDCQVRVLFFYASEISYVLLGHCRAP
jgi:hypothetical protein